MPTPSRLPLHTLYGLADGWLDGAGKAPSVAGLVWFETTWPYRWTDGLPAPHVYPTEAGGLSLEWSLPSYEVSVDVNLDAKTGQLQVVQVSAGAVAHEQALDLSQAAAWQALAETLSNITAAAAETA